MNEAEPIPSDITAREILTTVENNEIILALIGGKDNLDFLTELSELDEPIDEGELIGGFMTAAAMSGADPEDVLSILISEGIIEDNPE